MSAKSKRRARSVAQDHQTPQTALPPRPGVDLIRKHELAQRLGINRWTLMRWCREGKFPPPIRLSDIVIAWRVSDVEAWLQQRAAAAKAA
jgi:prophage regulatory protein